MFTTRWTASGETVAHSLIILMDVPAKIASVEAELGELKAQLRTPTSEAERVALHQRIATTNEVLAGYLKLLPGKNLLFSYLYFLL